MEIAKDTRSTIILLGRVIYSYKTLFFHSQCCYIYTCPSINTSLYTENCTSGENTFLINFSVTTIETLFTTNLCSHTQFGLSKLSTSFDKSYWIQFLPCFVCAFTPETICLTTALLIYVIRQK